MRKVLHALIDIPFPENVGVAIFLAACTCVVLGWY
jgi:hypothetical protein